VNVHIDDGVSKRLVNWHEHDFVAVAQMLLYVF
jgi:hypothetical protein